MEEHKNYIDLDGFTYLITYLSDKDFEEIEILKIENQGDDFTNIISESDKQRILDKLL